ncbi:hypothetical protein L8R84_10280 [Vibrio splendidus]|uniref:hypothetical protein n=1 Tax=Vibrio TaxID=662 RepID=UPI001BD4AB21|nr:MULTISPECIES: hypothetical protein [Vibrio]MDH5936532.1 hypothetical protein [Vibrio splendidus]
MDYSTLLDNLIFWGIFLPVFWLVWKSHAPMTFFAAHRTLLQRNAAPMIQMKFARRRR